MEVLECTERAQAQSANRKHGHPSVPSDILVSLTAHFSHSRVEYILRTLTPGELAVLGDLADALIVARIKRMPDARLRRFDQLVPHDGDHHLYRTLQMQWLRDEEYLLGTRLCRPPTTKELFVDFMSNDYGLRFRAYFSLKYPGRVRRARRPCRP
jgi:hypothetical protein